MKIQKIVPRDLKIELRTPSPKTVQKYKNEIL